MYGFEYRRTGFFYFFTVTGRCAVASLSLSVSLSCWLNLKQLFWISSTSWLHSSPPSPILKKSPHYSSSSPLNTFPFRLIKFHRVGRGSEEGGSTHMSNRSCYFSGVALSWAAKHPPAKSSHCKTNVVASLVGDIKNGNTSHTYITAQTLLNHAYNS